MQYRQDIVTHYAGGVNNYLNSNQPYEVFGTTLRQIFLRFPKNSAASLRILLRHLTTELQNL